MRVLFWSEAFWPYLGGIELFLARLARGLLANGHQVSALTAHGALELPDVDRFEDVPIRRIDLFRAFAERRPDAILRCRRAVADVVADFAPDVVHLNPMGPGALLVTQAIGPRRPVVVSIHAGMDGLGSAASDTAFGAMLRRASWVTASARSALDQVTALEPSVATRSSIIPLGIPVPPVAPGLPASAARRLLCAGRLVPMKGFDVAIAALARLLPDFPDLALTIAGDGPERAALEAQAARAGIADRVAFLGWTSPEDLVLRMQEASVILVPSRAEGTAYTEALTLVALEAAAVARPVVASRVGGLVEAVVDGGTGVLVEPDDAAALARATAALLADPARAAALGRAGHARTRREHGWQRTLDDFQDLFLRLTRETVGENATTAS